MADRSGWLRRDSRRRGDHVHTPGYTFAGWATSPGGLPSVPAGTTYIMTRDVILYATWQGGRPTGPSRPAAPPLSPDFGIVTMDTTCMCSPR